MKTTTSTHHIKSLAPIIKGLLLLALVGVLYYELFVRHDIIDLKTEFVGSLAINGGWILFGSAAVLMPINWLLETIKWRSLVTIFQKMDFSAALRSVLAGVSMAIMTPGRIGEYGGRQVGIVNAHRSDAIIANLISSLGQNIINIGVGLFAAVMFFGTYIEIQQGVFLTLLFVSVAVICVLLVIYVRVDLLGGLLSYLPQWTWIIKARNSVETFAEMDQRHLILILVLSGARYGVYVAQYVLLLYFFGVTDQFLPAVLGVCTLFFLQSNLPLPPVLSVLARGETAIYLWSFFTANVLGIVAATFTLWILNLVIPAVVGGVIISQASILGEEE